MLSTPDRMCMFMLTVRKTSSQYMIVKVPSVLVSLAREIDCDTTNSCSDMREADYSTRDVITTITRTSSFPAAQLEAGWPAFDELNPSECLLRPVVNAISVRRPTPSELNKCVIVQTTR